MLVAPYEFCELFHSFHLLACAAIRPRLVLVYLIGDTCWTTLPSATMKSVVALLSFASLAVAAPVECAVAATTATCTVITTTVMSTNVGSVLATMASATVTMSALAGMSTPFPRVVQDADGLNSCLGSNVQLFTGTLGGPPPPVVSSSGERPFSVNGDTFVNIGAAVGRSCDIQHNACANAANGGSLSGGVGQCDTQDQACKVFNNLARRSELDLGSCSDATILFENGLDGRNTAAFIAENQDDFNHGSALNIGVIAGFICQRLGSPCNAPPQVQSSCSSASAAAVATAQNQAAADVFNAVMGGGGAAAAVATTTAPPAVETAGATECAATAAAAEASVVAVVLTITSCF